jgi:predicted dehydrogenase
MLKVAIVGCGKIADDHAAQIQRIRGSKIVGACDRELLMAKQFAERFGVEHYSTNLAELLAKARPDVVHVTTPPQSHFVLGKECLEHGCHVYMEKPFTLDVGEAQALVRMAEAKGLKLTVGHDDQFSHVARRMRSVINGGYLGGRPVHMESYFCYDLSDPSYARAFLTDKSHWVRSLPGQLLHNIISHGLARVAEFMSSDSPQVIAHGFVSPALRAFGETELIDELRVIISEDDCTTAYFTFSSQMRPQLHQFRIYGPENGLIVDQDQEIIIRLRGSRHKSYAEKFIPPASFAAQYAKNGARNVRAFLGNDFHMKGGMKYLIESFHHSILNGTPVPIPYREIVLTAKLMDEIFEQVCRKPHAGAVQPAWRSKGAISRA